MVCIHNSACQMLINGQIFKILNSLECLQSITNSQYLVGTISRKWYNFGKGINC